MESFHHWLLIMIKVNVGKKFWHWKKKPKTCSKRSLNLRLFSNLQMRINLPWRKYLFFHQRLAILLKSYCVLRQFLGQFRFSPLLYVSLDECVLLRTKNKSERRFVWRSTWLNSYWLYQFTCICEWIWICVYPGNGFWWGKSCWCYHWMRGVFLRTDHPCKRQGKWKNPR